MAAKYPAFKTYEGIELANPANRIRMDLNDKNFHGYFMTDQGEFFIAPVDGPDKNLYMVFKKENAPFQKLPFENMQRWKFSNFILYICVINKPNFYSAYELFIPF